TCFVVATGAEVLRSLSISHRGACCAERFETIEQEDHGFSFRGRSASRSAGIAKARFQSLVPSRTGARILVAWNVAGCGFCETGVRPGRPPGGESRIAPAPRGLYRDLLPRRSWRSHS